MSHKSQGVYNQLVKLAGKLFPSEDEIHQIECLLNEHQNLDPTTLLSVTRTQAVVPQVYYNLQSRRKENSTVSFLDQFFIQAEEYLERKKKIMEMLLADLEHYATHAQRESVKFMVIKGACLQYLYPSESFRQFKDVDLVISKETVWKGIDIFKHIRYHPKRIRLESHPYSELASTEVYANTLGIVQMMDLDGYRGAFDIHLGSFPGCGDSILESEIWERATTFLVGSQEVLMPSLEDCILITCAHVTRHGYTPLKELNDIYAGLRYTEYNLDWDYLYHFSRKNTLQTILYGILKRLESDYEAKLPEEITSKLKPDRFERLASKFIFRPGKLNLNFHGGRQLFLGRFLQSFVLYRYYRQRTSFLRAVKESLLGMYFLFQTGRPYRLWKQRKTRSSHSNRRTVIVPIEASNGTERWQINRISLQKVQQFAEKAGISVAWIGKGIMAWNAGHRYELLLTPHGIYAQSPYDGKLEEETLKEIQRVAYQVSSRLVEVQAILAGNLPLKSG